jgi:hypothetical protein
VNSYTHDWRIDGWRVHAGHGELVVYGAYNGWQSLLIDDDARAAYAAVTAVEAPDDQQCLAVAETLFRRWKDWLWEARALAPWETGWHGDEPCWRVDERTQLIFPPDGSVQRWHDEVLTIFRPFDMGVPLRQAIRQRDVPALVAIMQLLLPRQPQTYRQQLDNALPPPNFERSAIREIELDGQHVYVRGCLRTIWRRRGDPTAVSYIVVIPPEHPEQPEIRAIVPAGSRRCRPPMGDYEWLYHDAAQEYNLLSMLHILDQVLTNYRPQHCDACATEGPTVTVDSMSLCEDCIITCWVGHPMYQGHLHRCRHCGNTCCPDHCSVCLVCHQDFCANHYDDALHACAICARQSLFSTTTLLSWQALAQFDGEPALAEIRQQLPLRKLRGWQTIEVIDQPRRILIRAVSDPPVLDQYDNLPLDPCTVFLCWAIDDQGRVLKNQDGYTFNGMLYINGEHPHVLQGQPCWGNLGSAWYLAQESQEIDIMLTVVFDFLSSYNPQSAYLRLSEIASYHDRWQRYARDLCNFCHTRGEINNDVRGLEAGMNCCVDCQATCAICEVNAISDYLCVCCRCEAAVCVECVSYCLDCGSPCCREACRQGHIAECPYTQERLRQRQATY